MQNKTPKITIATIVITAIVLIGVAAMFIYGEQEPTVTMADGNIEISGMYGTVFPVSDINSVSLAEKSLDEIAPDAWRTNGYGGLGQTRGYLRSDEIGDFLAFTNSAAAPTILIERTEGENIYISFSDGAKTKTLYDELKSWTQE